MSCVFALCALVFVGSVFCIMFVGNPDAMKREMHIILVKSSFKYELTEYDSIIAADVLEDIDALLRIKSIKNKYDNLELQKYALLLRTHQFDEARRYVSEFDFCKDQDVPGYDEYLNMRIDFLDNKARGNDSALAASANLLYDYLRKQVASRDFEVFIKRGKHLSPTSREAACTEQLKMLKAIAVYFKEPADTAELADWLYNQSRDFRGRLIKMPGHQEAKGIVFSALP